MTPKSLALASSLVQMVIVIFYDNVEFLQTYPKIYEDALGCVFFVAFLFLWQMERK